VAPKYIVFERIEQTKEDIINKKMNVGRISQVASSWKNFLSSPLIGKGYKNAAAGRYESISRSNFQYTQILASGGLILFIIYFYFVYRLYANSIELLFNDKIVLFIFMYVLILFLFRRPSGYLGIAAYIVYHQTSKNEHKVNAQNIIL
jgi:O-antigen ligase